MSKNSQKLFTPLEKSFSVLLRYYISPKHIYDKMTTPHFHEQYELVFVDSGLVIYNIENQIYKLKKGDFALIPPYTAHITEIPDKLEMYIINFKKTYIERYLNQITSDNILANLNGRVYRNNADIPYVSDNNRNIVRQIYNEYEKEGESEENTMCPYLLFVLLQSISKYSKAEKSYEYQGTNLIKETLINRILGYINLHYNQITCLEEIANNFFISKAHLCRLFKKETDYTAIQYLTNLKIQNAIELFKSTNYSVIKVSEAVGFESVSYFSKVFKAKTGYSPSVYRKMSASDTALPDSNS